MQGVRIAGNRIRPVNDCRVGMLVLSAFTEMSTGDAVHNAIDGLEISANDIADCDTGILVTPMLNWGAAGTSMGNRMTNVRIDDNTIAGARIGILASGGMILGNELGLENASGAAAVGNTLSGLELAGNTVTATERGIALYGGVAIDAPGTVTNNALLEVVVGDNDMGSTPTGCSAESNGVLRSDATVNANVIEVDPSRCDQAQP